MSGNHAYFAGQLFGLLQLESARQGWQVQPEIDAAGDYTGAVTVTTVSGTKLRVITAEVPGTNPDPDGEPPLD